MEKNKNLAPENWKGFRDIDLKPQMPAEFGGLNKNENEEKVDQDANPDVISPQLTEEIQTPPSRGL